MLAERSEMLWSFWRIMGGRSIIEGFGMRYRGWRWRLGNYNAIK